MTVNETNICGSIISDSDSSGKDWLDKMRDIEIELETNPLSNEARNSTVISYLNNNHREVDSKSIVIEEGVETIPPLTNVTASSDVDQMPLPFRADFVIMLSELPTPERAQIIRNMIASSPTPEEMMRSLLASSPTPEEMMTSLLASSPDHVRATRASAMREPSPDIGGYVRAMEALDMRDSSLPEHISLHDEMSPLSMTGEDFDIIFMRWFDANRAHIMH